MRLWPRRRKRPAADQADLLAAVRRSQLGHLAPRPPNWPLIIMMIALAIIAVVSLWLASG